MSFCCLGRDIMSFSTFHIYLRTFFPRIPDWHWIVIGVAGLASTIYFLTQKKSSVYGAVALGLAVFIGLYLLDALALNRIGLEGTRKTGFDLESEWHRLLHGGRENRMLMLFNVAAFVPFGFFLAEFLASTKRFSAGRRIGLVVLVGFGLSLCIECIQLVFRVGIFELTDLVLNCVGAIGGAGVAVGVRKMLEWGREKACSFGPN